MSNETNRIQVTRSDDDAFRDRIANTLYQELSIELPAAMRGADAVIRELPELQPCPFCDLPHNKCGCLRTADGEENKAGELFVDFTPEELRAAADIVENFRELYQKTFKITEGHDDLPPTWPVPIIDAQLPVRVVCGDADWVLRVGGSDDER